jgi:hypothetical protein
MIGDKKAPSSGGEGEVKSFVVKSKTKSFDTVIENLVTQLAPKIIDTLSTVSEDEIELARSVVSESIFSEEDSLGLQVIIGELVGSRSLVSVKFDGLEDEFRSVLGEQYQDVNLSLYISRLESNIKKSLNGFIGKTVAYLLSDELFGQNAFAPDADIQYNLIVSSVKSRIENQLSDFVSIHVNDEAQKILSQIKMEN